MPLEVRQIGIRMSVGDEAGRPPDSGRGAQAQCPGSLDPEERQAIVEQCVRQVLGALKTGRER